ncbi:MAG: SMP-30/gluconolactonase/LRE family protein [Janthinobacterium lividum]
MRRLASLTLIGVLAVSLSSSGSTGQVSSTSVDLLRFDPALDALVAPGVKPELLKADYVFTEGPMWREGKLWFSDEEGDRVHAITPDGHDEVLVDYAEGPLAAPHGSKIGPNAMATDPSGGVVLLQQYGRAVVHLIGDPNGDVPVHPVPFFDSYGGKRLNSPNDLVFLPDGSFFFTDPPYGLKQGDKDPAKELPYNAVFHYKDGKLSPVIMDLTLPNGIALSPDNHTLYVNNSGPAQRVIAYPLHADGSVGTPHDVIDFTGKEGDGVPDGMKVDARGNIWTTGPGGIRIITPAGKVLGQIKLEKVAANVAWGGEDGRTLYIMARSHVYRLQTLVGGNLPVFRR